MDKATKEEIQLELHRLREEVLRNIIAENNDFRAAVEASGVQDLADIASNTIDAHTLGVMGAQDTRRLKKIESALGRLENDKFGNCANCGNKISYSRLKAIPYVLMCINCQQASERRRSQQNR